MRQKPVDHPWSKLRCHTAAVKCRRMVTTIYRPEFNGATRRRIRVTSDNCVEPGHVQVEIHCGRRIRNWSARPVIVRPDFHAVRAGGPWVAIIRYILICGALDVEDVDRLRRSASARVEECRS